MEPSLDGAIGSLTSARRHSDDAGSQGDWTTVHSKSGRHQRKAAALGAGVRFAAPASQGEGSSPGTATPVVDDKQEARSSSLPPEPGLLQQALESAWSDTLLPSPRQPTSPHQFLAVSPSHSATLLSPRTLQHGAAAALSRQSSLGERQDSLLLSRQEGTSHSALSLHDLGKLPLRSSRSDVVALATARQMHDERSTTLEGIPESARGAGAAAAAGSAAAGQAPGATPARRAPASVPGQPFHAYLRAELHPGPSYPVADVVWGQTERDRVYNAIVSVPYQLERFLVFGVALSLDSFLAVFTMLPLRVGMAVLALGRALLAQARGRGTAGVHAADGTGPAAVGGQALRGDHLFDLICAAMSLGVVVFLWNVNAGTLYFWMKDLTQELLKLSVLHTALDLSDKICCSFGVDVLEALAASCTQLAAGWGRRAAYNVACDALVASLLLALHAVTLMSQAMVFGVAMNSKKNTLVALLIAANFTEIKGTVLKRFDATKLYSLACQDAVERFHLLLVLAFVVVEEMGNSGSRSPNRTLLAGCARIYAGEVVIDVIKHAVLGKFNEIRPGVYREFMRDLCDRVSRAQSHNVHKLVGFEPFAAAALFFRIALTAAALRSTEGGGLAVLRPPQALWFICAALVSWALLFVAKLALGYLLKLMATAYVEHYELQRATGRAGPLRRAVAIAAAGPAAQQQQQQAGKKEE